MSTSPLAQALPPTYTALLDLLTHHCPNWQQVTKDWREIARRAWPPALEAARFNTTHSRRTGFHHVGLRSRRFCSRYSPRRWNRSKCCYDIASLFLWIACAAVTQHARYSARRAFHLSGCILVRSDGVSISRSNHEVTLIWSLVFKSLHHEARTPHVVGLLDTMAHRLKWTAPPAPPRSPI
jgi:hypothetical protein